MNSLADVDWSSLPQPTDDGATDHLTGFRLPSALLASTEGIDVDISMLRGRSVIYVYPMTGRPDAPLPGGWDEIPGARGCTPQSCSFRDHFRELKAAGVTSVLGVSTQSSADQEEAVERLHLPYPLLCDSDLKLHALAGLPIFEADGIVCYKRVTLVLGDATIEKVFYPVFPPDRNPEHVLAWLNSQAPNL